MRRLLIVIISVVLLAVALMLPQINDIAVAFHGKTGLVIDAESGEPMPHVIVIAAGWTTHSFFMPGGYNSLYRIVTSTDANGRYHIPGTGENWRKANLPIKGTRTGWSITPFRIGYAVVGDDKAWSFDERGETRYRLPSGLIAPTYSYKGSELEVDDILMFKPRLNLKEAAVYYSLVITVGHPLNDSKEPGDVAMRARSFEFFAPWVCSTDPHEEIDWAAMTSLMEFVEDQSGAPEVLFQLAPQLKGYVPYEMKKTTAAVACKVITNGRGVP